MIALLALAAAPLLPMASACTTDSLLCPADSTRDSALGAMADAEGQATGAVDDVQETYVPAVLAAESDAFGQVDGARGAADDAFTTTLPAAVAAIEGAPGMAADTALPVIVSLPGMVNGKTHQADASITDLQDNTVGPAVGGIDDTVASVQEDLSDFQADPVDWTLAFEYQFEEPVDKDVNDVWTIYIQPSLDGVNDVISGLHLDPVFDIYDGLKGAAFEAANYNYGLLANRISALPPESTLEGAEAGLP